MEKNNYSTLKAVLQDTFKSIDQSDEDDHFDEDDLLDTDCFLFDDDDEEDEDFDDLDRLERRVMRYEEYEARHSCRWDDGCGGCPYFDYCLVY